MEQIALYASLCEVVSVNNLPLKLHPWNFPTPNTMPRVIYKVFEDNKVLLVLWPITKNEHAPNTYQLGFITWDHMFLIKTFRLKISRPKNKLKIFLQNYHLEISFKNEESIDVLGYSPHITRYWDNILVIKRWLTWSVRFKCWNIKRKLTRYVRFDSTT